MMENLLLMSGNSISTALLPNSIAKRLYSPSSVNTRDLYKLCHHLERQQEDTLSIDTKTGDALYAIALDIKAQLARLEVTAQTTLKQAEKTNGRVDRLEERIKTLEFLKYWIMGMGAAIGVIVTMMWKFLEVYNTMMRK